MNQKSNEGGQALILIALAAIGLFAFAALAIDGSRSFSNKRHAQNAADTAALTAALKYIRTGNNYTLAEAEAVKRAASNGYVTDWPTTIVDVDRCDATSDPDPATGVVTADVACEGMQGASSEYIRVRIISEIPTTFGRVLGRETLQAAAEAVVRVQGSSSTSSMPEEAVVALKKEDCGVCADGAAGIVVKNSGVFSNSTSCTGGKDSTSISLNVNGNVYAEDGFIMAAPGCGFIKGTADWEDADGNPSKKWEVGASIDPVYDIPAPSITCATITGDELDTTNHIVHAGWHTSKVQISSTDEWTFEEGNHCFTDGVHSTADTVHANNVNFLLQGGDLIIGGKDFTCQNMLVFSDGGSGMHFGGTTDIDCDGVTFYMKSGDVSWSGSANITLKAQTSGTYKGLLIYLPADYNSSTIQFSGTSGNEIVGSIIAPASLIRLGGTQNSTGLDVQVVGYKVETFGTSNTTINYNPATKYSPPNKPTIKLTK